MSLTCDREVYLHGSTFVIIHDGGAAVDYEEFCGLLREAVDPTDRVDWHYVAGRAVFKCLGDLDRVRRAAVSLLLLKYPRWRWENHHA